MAGIIKFPTSGSVKSIQKGVYAYFCIMQFLNNNYHRK